MILKTFKIVPGVCLDIDDQHKIFLRMLSPQSTLKTSPVYFCFHKAYYQEIVDSFKDFCPQDKLSEFENELKLQFEILSQIESSLETVSQSRDLSEISLVCLKLHQLIENNSFLAFTQTDSDQELLVQASFKTPLISFYALQKALKDLPLQEGDFKRLFDFLTNKL